jgi:hypothetical protein
MSNDDVKLILEIMDEKSNIIKDIIIIKTLMINNNHVHTIICIQSIFAKTFILNDHHEAVPNQEKQDQYRICELIVCRSCKNSFNRIGE